jgi:molybdopterin-containing oxidoreductase family membrane subunit
MIEKALKGEPRYYMWIVFLLGIIGVGMGCWFYQLYKGLGITGMGRDISWGVYIAQFTYLVGVAASAVMIVIPLYLHDYKKYGKIVVFGEFLAIAAVTMCMLFIVVDVGQPQRMLNVLLHPTPNSILFYDMIVLVGYLCINIIVGYNCLLSDARKMPHPGWVKPFIYISIPWAVSIHTVTAFLYAGLPGRHLWLTAVMAPRFLASAFASGPALLILVLLIISRVSKFDPGRDALQTIAKTVCYAMIINLFLVGMEIFTAFYSNIPGHMHPLQYLFVGLHGHGKIVAWMWTAAPFAFIGVLLLLIPSARKHHGILAFACASIFMACWIDKVVALVIGGFIPNPFHRIIEYSATFPEISITLAIWAIGALILTVLHKVAITVREEEAST